MGRAWTPMVQQTKHLTRQVCELGQQQSRTAELSSQQSVLGWGNTGAAPRAQEVAVRIGRPCGHGSSASQTSTPYTQIFTGAGTSTNSLIEIKIYVLTCQTNNWPKKRRQINKNPPQIDQPTNTKHHKKPRPNDSFSDYFLL